MNASNEQVITIGGFSLAIGPHYAEPILKDIRGGGYEGRERTVVPRLFNPLDRIMEVGTAIGLVTMTAAKVVGAENITSFEANPVILADARRNFSINGLERITTTHAFLKNRANFSGANSSEKFYVHPEFWASNSIAGGGKTEIEVPCACLEDEIESFEANAIICDIEGGEVDLFLGADLSRITKILLEIHYWAGRPQINMLIRQLVRDGFSVDFDHSGQSIVTMHRGISRPYE